MFSSLNVSSIVKGQAKYSFTARQYSLQQHFFFSINNCYLAAITENSLKKNSV